MAPSGSALAQWQERDYAARYRGWGEPILVGVEFSRQTRNLTAFEVGDGRPTAEASGRIRHHRSVLRMGPG